MKLGAVVQLLRDHSGAWSDYGDGYTEPREAWVTCVQCDTVLWFAQQYYFENDEDPEHAIRQHQAYMLREAGMLKEPYE